MSTLSNVPVLLITLPILLAAVPLLLGIRFRRSGWTVATITTGVLFGLTGYLGLEVYGNGEIVIHRLGGYPRPIGIELVADELSTLIALLVTGVSFGVLAYTRLGGPRGTSFYSGYLLLIGGLLGVVFTGDIFNMFVFLEIAGLATYALIAKGDGAESAVAALKYLIVGTVGASLYLLGVGFLFMATGTLNMIDLATTIPTVEGGYENTLVRAGFVCMFVGFAIKVAQWPLHSWQPDAYQHAPDGVTPVIAALVSTVSAYALARILYSVFTVDFLLETPYARETIVVVGSISVVIGSVLAVIQRDVKRMLAYSSVSQFGLIVAAFGIVTETAFVGAIIHLFGHGLMKAGLFIGVAIVAYEFNVHRVNGYAGLASRRPGISGAIALLLIALVGIPPSIGFLGKWYIGLGAVQAEVWSVAAVIFLSTMLTLAYAALIAERMYFTSSNMGPMKSPSIVTDGGIESDQSDRRTIGMIAVLAAITASVILLGFAGGIAFELLDPFVTEVFSG